jgi:hypothetical protein
MKPPMRHTALKWVSTRNAYGDYSQTATVALPCHFRYITEQVTGVSNETVQADAQAWFNPDSGIQKKDIITIDNENFRVERVIKGRRLRDSTVQFLKTDLLSYGVVS